jgi:hypothetical protein
MARSRSSRADAAVPVRAKCLFLTPASAGRWGGGYDGVILIWLVVMSYGLVSRRHTRPTHGWFSAWVWAARTCQVPAAVMPAAINQDQQDVPRPPP